MANNKVPARFLTMTAAVTDNGGPHPALPATLLRYKVPYKVPQGISIFHPPQSALLAAQLSTQCIR